MISRMLAIKSMEEVNSHKIVGRSSRGQEWQKNLIVSLSVMLSAVLGIITIDNHLLLSPSVGVILEMGKRGLVA